MASLISSNVCSYIQNRPSNFYISFGDIINKFGGKGKTTLGLDTNLKFRIKNEIKIIQHAEMSSVFFVTYQPNYGGRIHIEPFEIHLFKKPCITVHEKKILLEIKSDSPEINFMKKLNTNFDIDWITNIYLNIYFWAYDNFGNFLYKINLVECDIISLYLDRLHSIDDLIKDGEINKILKLYPREILKE